MKDTNWPADDDLCLDESPDVAATAGFLKALAHEGRLAILCNLIDGEQTVGALERAIGARQASVSQHLARLRYEGLVRGRREGKTILYSLGDPKVRPVVETLRALFPATAAD